VRNYLLVDVASLFLVHGVKGRRIRIGIEGYRVAGSAKLLDY